MTMLDAMLLRDCDDTDTDAQAFTQRDEEARQFVRVRITRLQSYDAERYTATPIRHLPTRQESVGQEHYSPARPF